MPAKSTEVAAVDDDFAALALSSGKTPATVNDVVSFSDIQSMARVAGLDEADVVFLANPYTVLQNRDKDKLIGIPFMIRYWRFTQDEKTKRYYVVAYCVTRDDEMFILTDGSTGIKAQLASLTVKRKEDGHKFPDQYAMIVSGLTRSDYDYEDDKGEISEAHTYYLA
jgi:hypothetical protein